jgi:hypothetical protein
MRRITDTIPGMTDERGEHLEEARTLYLDQEIDALDRRVSDDARKSGVLTLQSAYLGLKELLRDRRFALVMELTDKRR